MADNGAITSKEVVRFKGRVEGGVLVPDEALDLPDGTYWVSVTVESSSAVDALDEIAALARPIGPADLAENFDRYTGRVIEDGRSGLP